MKKLYIFTLILSASLIFLGCVDQSVYQPMSPTFSDWRLWTGILLFIEIAFYIFGTIKAKNEEFFSNLIVGLIGLPILTALQGYIILGEWWYRFNLWLLSGTIGTIFIVIFSLIFGYIGSILISLPIWVINGFFWHSSEIAKYILFPLILGTTIKIILSIVKREKLTETSVESILFEKGDKMDLNLFVDKGKNTKQEQAKIKENIITLFGIDKLPEDKKEETINQIGKIIFQAVLLRVLPIMDKKSLSEYDELIDKNVSPDQLIYFFIQKVPGFLRILSEESENFRKEYEYILSKIK